MKRKYKLILVAGARPNFMKIAPIIRELRKYRDQPPTHPPCSRTVAAGSYVVPRRSEDRDQKTDAGSVAI